ncbi:MAG: four helix bundle protein [Nitrospirae bacterium]|nr:four helix bundle protein [Nitrospirota bacterium]
MDEPADNVMFSFEKLDVWQKSVDYAHKVLHLIEKIETDRKHYRLIENCEASAVSVPSNIAEGCGRYSNKEFVQYLYIARGSLYESITQLILFSRSGWVTDQELRAMKKLSVEIGKMISALIRSLKSKRSNNQ